MALKSQQTGASDDVAQLNVRVPGSVARAAKRLADMQGAKLSEWVQGLIEAEIRRDLETLRDSIEEAHARARIEAEHDQALLAALEARNEERAARASTKQKPTATNSA